MDNKPDYVGAWNCCDFAELTEYAGGVHPRGGRNHFQLFINKKEDGKFEGRSLDRFGVADIAGIETEGKIEFTKIYTPQAQANGGSCIPLNHKGIKTTCRVDLNEDKESELVAGIIKQPYGANVFIMRKL
jgi:hypothetical protein